MKKIVILMILLAFSLSVLSCGGGAGSSNSPGGENPGVPTIVRLLPSHYIALTNSIITLHAKVLDGNGRPVKNISVAFTNQSPIGTLSSTTGKTNNSGIATVTIKSTVVGFATIQAEVNKGVSNVRDKKTVFFSSTLSLTPYLVLDVDGNGNGTYNENSDVNLFEGGNADDNQVVVRATVYNKFGQRASGSTVTFSADSTEATFPNGSSATTDSAGEAFVLVKVTPMTVRNLQTVLNITASADNGAANLVSLFLQPVTVTSIDVTANPTIIAPTTQDNESTSTISASVKMLNSLPVPDDSTVSFIASCGTVTPFAQTVSGVATATFTAPSTVPSSPCRVTASIAGLSDFVDITVTTALSVLPTPQSVNGLTGGAVSFTVSGGIAPYTVTSGNKNIACNSTDNDCSDAEDSGTWVISTPDGSGNYTFTVTVPANTATQNVSLIVRDAAANQVNATVNISGTALSVQPGTVSKDGTTAGDVIFTIFGGVPPYDIFPNIANAVFAPNPAHVTNSGGTFTVSVPVTTTTTTIIYTVRDSAASTTTATLNITPGTAFALSPSSVTVDLAAGSVTYHITGGTPPYDVYTSNSTIVTVNGGAMIDNLATNTFTAELVNVGNATITVIDSTGQTKTATIGVSTGGGGGGTGQALSISPTAVTVAALQNPDSNDTDNIDFALSNIAGGVVSCVSSHPSIIASPGAISTITGNAIATIDPNAVASTTLVTLTCTDGNGFVAAALVTVQPPGLLISVDPIHVIGRANPDANSTDNATVTVIGGVAPYIVNVEPFALTTIVPGGPWTCSSLPCVIPVDPTNVLANTAVTFKVTDGIGTEATANFVVYTEDTGLVASTDKENVIGLANAPDGDTADDVTITVAGANGPFIVSWVCSIGATPVGPVVLAGPSGSVTFDPGANTGASPVACTVNVTDNLGSAATLNVSVWP